MGIINWLKGVWAKLFRKEIKDNFNAEIQLSPEMEEWIRKFYRITGGNPPWVSREDNIKTISFARFIDNFTAKLVTLDVGITMPETPRGEYLQKHADYVLEKLKENVSLALGNCGVMFKPNQENVDYVKPGYFVPTATNSNGDILGCVFVTRVDKEKYTYHKFEWHRFENVRYEDGEEGKAYRISNVAYRKDRDENPNVSINTEDAGKPCPLTEVPEWAGIAPEVAYEGVERPLFAYFKNPAPNYLEPGSALGIPIWGDCIAEIEDIDVAWSRKSEEISDSRHTTFVPESAVRFSQMHGIKMERWVKPLELGGTVGEDTIREHVPTLLTEQRISDINADLSMISMKCGFSQGTFTFNEKTGIVTATQIESDDQETISTIKDIRDALQKSLEQLFYALNVMADMYTDLPAEDWETLKENISWAFTDITFNAEEDRTRAMLLTDKGYYPKEYYLQKWEGYSEDEALELIQRAQAGMEVDEKLFGEE